jgi:hypothetical protein
MGPVQPKRPIPEEGPLNDSSWPRFAPAEIVTECSSPGPMGLRLLCRQTQSYTSVRVGEARQANFWVSPSSRPTVLRDRRYPGQRAHEVRFSRPRTLSSRGLFLVPSAGAQRGPWSPHTISGWSFLSALGTLQANTPTPLAYINVLRRMDFVSPSSTSRTYFPPHLTSFKQPLLQTSISSTSRLPPLFNFTSQTKRESTISTALIVLRR